MFLGRLGNFAVQMYTESMHPPPKDKIKEGAKLIQPSKYDKSMRKAAPPAIKKKPVAAAKPKPKPAPAAAAKEESKNEDVEMTEPVKKPPPNIGKKPAPAAKPAPAKAAAKPSAQEEDDSGGLTPEEAIDKINEYFDAEIIA